MTLKVSKKLGRKKPLDVESVCKCFDSLGDDFLHSRGIWRVGYRTNTIVCINSVFARARAAERNSSGGNGVSSISTPSCTCMNRIEREDKYFSSHDYNGGRHACTASTHKANCALWTPPLTGHLHSWRGRRYDTAK